MIENEKPEGFAVSKDEAYRSLASAILLRMLEDINKGYFDEEFLLSEWCEDISYVARVCYPKFKLEAYKMFFNNPRCKVGFIPLSAN